MSKAGKRKAKAERRNEGKRDEMCEQFPRCQAEARKVRLGRMVD